MKAKDLGDYAEAKFTLFALEKGFSILRPYSDSLPYDFVVEKDGKFSRIQVKSCSSKLNERGLFHTNVGKKHKGTKGRYTSADADVIAVYIRTLDLFYLIPIRFIRTVTINLYPLKSVWKFNEFIENWNIWQSH